MKKFLKFFRSMKFGLILLVLIMVISFFGTVITQGKSEEFYLATYSAGNVIVALGLDNVYYTPYFLGLGVLLILNLTMCSLVRFRSIFHAGKDRLAASVKVTDGTKATEEETAKIRTHLEKKHYHQKREGAVTVYYKNQVGHIGSFLVHLSMVLILLVGALVIYTGKSEVYPVSYDGPVTLEDGTVVSLVDFVTQDEEGNVHYESTLNITAPGQETYTGQTSVNHPINYGGKKYFQDTYYFTTKLKIWNTATSVGDQIYLSEPAFLQTSDSGQGIYYMGAYTDYTEEADGQISLRSDQIEDGKPAVFLVSVYDGTDGAGNAGLVEQGTTLQVEDIQFTFDGLITYPGIRIKETNRVLMGCLYATFVIMLAGLWFCFFQQPVYITIGKNDKGWFYRIGGPRNTEGLENEIALCLE